MLRESLQNDGEHPPTGRHALECPLIGHLPISPALDLALLAQGIGVLPPASQSSFPRLLLSAREAAVALGISERTLWTLTHAGEVPCLRIGRLVKYRPEALAAWLATKEEGGVADA